MCQPLTDDLTCCLPCPITDWVYPDSFSTLSDVASWISVVGTVACLFLLVSYAFLPVEKTNRHYLSISIVSAVAIMNVSLFYLLSPAPVPYPTLHGPIPNPASSWASSFLWLRGRINA